VCNDTVTPVDFVDPHRSRQSHDRRDQGVYSSAGAEVFREKLWT
jgi:hypothetical protein